jgi:hypothetical protein
MSWLDYYLGPTGVPDKLRAVGNALNYVNPVNAIGESMAASRRMMAPETDGWGRVEAAGDMLSGVAGVVAPGAIGARYGVPAAQGVQDAMMGFAYAPATRAAGNAFADFARAEDGAFAGIRARTADLGALERAQQMTASGASRDDVWRDTGWFRGVDGKWRFEIDDSGAYPFHDLAGGGKAAEDYITHDALFNAYPDIGNTYVTLAPEGGARGSYSPESDVIRLQNAGDRSTALHEFQHAIQRRQGFAKGGNLHDGAGIARDEATGEFLKIQDSLARDYEGLTPPQKRLWESYMFGSREAGQNAIIDSLDDRLIDMLSRANRVDALRRQASSISGDDAMSAYRRLAGEVEARNVQTRRDFTPDQRRATAPWATQDVPDDQQIIRGATGVNALRDYLGGL